MKKNLGPKTWLYPMPVLMIGTYDKNGNPDVMNAAWGGIHDHNEIGICLSRGHQTTQNILDQKAFTVSFADKDHVLSADYVGITSAVKEPAKLSKSGFTVTRSENVNAPVINELPLTLECVLKSANEEDGYYVGTIVNVVADESILNEKGLPDLDKYSPIIYDCATYDYRTLGEKVGLAYTDGNKLKK